MATTINNNYYGYPPPAYSGYGYVPPGYPYANAHAEPYMNYYQQDVPIGPLYPGGSPMGNYGGYGYGEQQNMVNLLQQNLKANDGFNDATKSAALNKQVLQDLETMLPKLGDGSGVITRSDMEAALNDDSGKFSSKEKAEINYILNVKQNGDFNSDLWTALNGHDDLVSTKDIDPALNSDLSPGSIHNDSLTPYKG